MTGRVEWGSTLGLEVGGGGWTGFRGDQVYGRLEPAEGAGGIRTHLSDDDRRRAAVAVGNRVSGYQAQVRSTSIVCEPPP